MHEGAQQHNRVSPEAVVLAQEAKEAPAYKVNETENRTTEIRLINQNTDLKKKKEKSSETEVRADALDPGECDAHGAGSVRTGVGG